ncbi:hypothetical protein DFH07DRAFT_374328 [Mycena maculata]|uniref:F-box domain-containing protein n=1 Tax=Mycena maculata TaxID=230809 RepID=A0AAD7H8N6_9AGAR|nr:hypothetical protein DFH07DRAFT_374328 [Mycena maculata]
MHRCLAIPEIIRIICNKLGADHAGHMALSRLAVTCRAFLNPALDPLWRHQDNLVAILGCIPDFWVHPEPVNVHGPKCPTLNPACIPTSADWARVLFYSTRIKSFSLPVYHSRELGASSDVLEFIHLSFPGDVLFPHVETLRVELYPSLMHHLRLFLSPKLMDIHLELWGSATRLALLPLLGAKCPLLTDLSVHFNSLDATPDLRARAASALVRSLNSIRTISIGAMDAAACRHLGSLANLTSLSIQMIHEPLLPVELHPTPSSSHSTFLSLRELNIHAERVELAIDFIPAISQSPLDSLDISIGTSALEPQSRHLCVILATLCSKAISSIDINLGGCTDDVSANPQAYTVVPATLKPLLEFGNLVHASVTVPFGLCLDNAFMHEMAVAWPYIEQLRLTRPYVVGEPSPPSQIDIASLLAFASHCPDLRTLTIPLSAQPPEPADVPNTPRATQSTLTVLRVQDSPIEAPFPIAAFLSSVFPALDRIRTAREGYHLEEDPAPHDAETHKKWKEVEKLVPLLVAVRDEDERHWRGQFGWM